MSLTVGGVRKLCSSCISVPCVFTGTAQCSEVQRGRVLVLGSLPVPLGPPFRDVMAPCSPTALKKEGPASLSFCPPTTVRTKAAQLGSCSQQGYQRLEGWVLSGLPTHCPRSPSHPAPLCPHVPHPPAGSPRRAFVAAARGGARGLEQGQPHLHGLFVRARCGAESRALLRWQNPQVR